MAVTKASPVRAYEYDFKGLSTDTKPTDCAVNSLFLELDTGKFYYFSGDDWYEIGTGGGPVDPNVLYEGKMMLSVQGEAPYQYSGNTVPFTMSRLPEDQEPVYLYVDDILIGTGAWTYNEEIPGEAPEDYEASFRAGDDYNGVLMYENNGGWKGMVSLADTSIVGEKTVEIRKTAKPVD